MAEHLSLSFYGCYCLDCPGPSCTCTTPPALFLSKLPTYYGMFIYTYFLRVSQSTPIISMQGQSQIFLLNSKLFWTIQRAMYCIHHITEEVFILAFTCSCCIKQVKFMTASLIQAMLLSSVHLSTKTIWLIGKCVIYVSLRSHLFPLSLWALSSDTTENKGSGYCSKWNDFMPLTNAISL